MERRTFLTSTGALGASSFLSSLFTKTARGASSVNGQNGLKNADRKSGSGANPIGTLSEDLSPYTGTWGDTQLRHLLRRCMFGMPESQFLAAQALGSMDAVVTKLLACQNLTTVPLPVLASSSSSSTPEAWLQTIPTSNPNLLAMEVQEIVNWWFDLMMQEKLSIRQKMTLMWTNHFVTGSSTVLVSAYVYQYLITCMTNALGNFKTFAQAITIDPAMLLYLNGNQNTYTTKNNNVNENYAREVMELFTLGINFPGTTTPNYTQNDVEANAQALTGWTPTTTYPFVGQFNSKHFDPNSKTFLGQTGNFGLTTDSSTNVIDIIFQQPTSSPAYPPGAPTSNSGGTFPEGYTAAYWACQTIYKEFVYYNPDITDPPPTDGSCPQGPFRDAMARLMLNPPSPYNPFDIAPVLQALLTSAHFYSDEVIGAQIKSPCEYMGSLVREFGLTYPTFVPSDPPDAMKKDGNNNEEYTDTNPTISIMTNAIMNSALGQQLLNPPNVAGWPGGENWLSAGSFQSRQNYSDLILSEYFVNANKNWNLAFSPTNYTEPIPNAGTLAEGVLFSDLEDVSLAFTLKPGGLEVGTLTPNPTKTDDVIDTAVPTFAAGLAQLPEFQLY